MIYVIAFVVPIGLILLGYTFYQAFLTLFRDPFFEEEDDRRTNSS